MARRKWTDPKKLAKHLKKRGWTVEATKGGHAKWTDPSGRFWIGASTPSDVRGFRNFVALLRRESAHAADLDEE